MSKDFHFLLHKSFYFPSWIAVVERFLLPVAGDVIIRKAYGTSVLREVLLDVACSVLFSSVWWTWRYACHASTLTRVRGDPVSDAVAAVCVCLRTSAMQQCVCLRTSAMVDVPPVSIVIFHWMGTVPLERGTVVWLFSSTHTQTFVQCRLCITIAELFAQASL